MAPFFTLFFCLFIIAGRISALSLLDGRTNALIQGNNHDDALTGDKFPPPNRPPYLAEKRKAHFLEDQSARSSPRPATATKIIAQVKEKRQSEPSSPSALPRAFDANLGNNFTSSSCPLFFSSFLNDPQFKNCHAVSMLLTTSSGFFAATKNQSQLNHVLDASCSVKRSNCSSIMDSYARQLRSAGGCESDFKRGNPNVLQAYDGFVAYDAVYDATCRMSSGSNGYCFTEAVMNKSAPTSSYVYYLPIGLSLPAGAMPACNKCLQKTMMDFRQYAGNATQPLSNTYGPAVKQIDLNCGPDFVDSSIPSVSGASLKLLPPVWIVVALATAAAGLW